MSDIQSQFSDQPLKQSTTQFTDEPMPARQAEPEAMASPPSLQRRLRLWPGVAIFAVQWAIVGTLQLFFDGEPLGFMSLLIGPMVGTLALLGWWLFFSRLSWTDRLGVPAACILMVGLMLLLADQSIKGMPLVFYTLPLAEAFGILWLVVSYPLVWLVPSYSTSWQIRRGGLLLGLMMVCGYFTLVRFDGVTGAFQAAMWNNWRWTPSAEDNFLADLAKSKTSKPVEMNAKPLALQPGDWPCFRGLNRDSRLTGVKIATDWGQNPPKLVWRHKVGPGWGSFAVIGKHLFTQEQWDKNEAVVCYDADTGKILWSHEYPARFWEAVAGVGPRATPTFHDGKIYAMGAAGKLCCLDAASGKELWSRDILADSEAKLPQWGFAASPLVMQGMVLVFTGAKDKCVMAYHADTGKIAWHAGDGEFSYSSLQGAKIDGVEQALMMTGDGLFALQPKTGAVLWNYEWKLSGAARCVQPGAVGNADFLLGSPFNSGTHRLHVAHDGDKWDAEKVWQSRAISPYFNDFVTHRDHMYGFTGELFACVDLDKGKLKWKERGYGTGQALLLADQDLLLLMAEQGEVAMLEANPQEHKELTRFKAIEGKTWNHPVVAHGRLYVRNGQEAACYQLRTP
ncbi:MAG TPA: PQQ-binding-like beta-propeller repeat protein [Gemmataceae bacterium]|nr:PQQ-binding-like beta-propeller repeat protein [Gemmataceae bacterium]